MDNSNEGRSKTISDWPPGCPSPSPIEETSSNKVNKRSSIKLSDKEEQSKFKIKVIVTQHLTDPCPRYYVDLFNIVLIECKDPEHQILSVNKEVNAV